MSDPVRLNGSGGILLLCDHASADVPAGIDLGVGPVVMEKHVAVDIGAEPLTRALSRKLGAPAILATVSRLVIDLHREPDHPALIPVMSDGIEVPGNRDADRFERIRRFHAPYHAAISETVSSDRPHLIVAIHSFTRMLETGGGTMRPMEAGVLYNRDDRAARIVLNGLRQAGVETGDNEPYSGRLLNATLNRHGEARGIRCVSIEVRNDLIADAAGVTRWSDLLAPIIRVAAEER